MAGAMRKMALYLGLVEDDRFEDDLMYGNDKTREHEAVGSRSGSPNSNRSSSDRSVDRGGRGADSIRVTDHDPDDTVSARRSPAVARASRDWRTDTMAQDSGSGHPAGTRAKVAPRASAGSDGYKITTLQPRSYSDARRIGEDFRNQTPVIMNLTEMDDVDAKRIVDFAAGLVFGLRGSIERVTNKVFLLSPANVDVGAAARAQLAQDGFFNQR